MFLFSVMFSCGCAVWWEVGRSILLIFVWFISAATMQHWPTLDKGVDEISRNTMFIRWAKIFKNTHQWKYFHTRVPFSVGDRFQILLYNSFLMDTTAKFRWHLYNSGPVPLRYRSCVLLTRSQLCSSRAQRRFCYRAILLGTTLYLYKLDLFKSEKKRKWRWRCVKKEGEPLLRSGLHAPDDLGSADNKYCPIMFNRKILRKWPT